MTTHETHIVNRSTRQLTCKQQNMVWATLKACRQLW